MGNHVLARYSVKTPGTNLTPGGTAVTVLRADGSLAAGKALAFSAATCTAAPILCDILDWIGVVDGTGATQVGSVRIFDRDGSDIVQPGTALVMTFVSLAAGVGITPKATYSAKWAEIPLE